MRLIKTLDKLMVLRFWQIIDEQNHLLLDLNYTPDAVYSDDEKEQIHQLWLDLYDEYFLLENDAMTKAVLRDNLDVIGLLNRINLLQECVNFLMMLCNVSKIITDETFDEVCQLNYSTIKKTEPRLNINYFGSVQKNIDITIKAIGALKTRYEIKHGRNVKDIDKQKKNVYDLVAKVGLALGGMQLNIREMNVLEWMAYKKLAIQQSEQKRSAAAKK